MTELAELKLTDPELEKKIKALKALVLTWKLLEEGHFQKQHFEALCQTQEFLMALHKQLAEEALAHPDAMNSPELVELKEHYDQSKKEV